MSVNGIDTRQNDEVALKLLSAQRMMYSNAKFVRLIEFLLVLTLPLVFSLLTALVPSLSPLAAIYNIFITIIDNTVINRIINNLVKEASLTQELFDEYVLKLETYAFNIYNRVSQEEIDKYSSKYIVMKKDYTELINWYSPEISKVDLSIGQLMAQRINVWWDSSLRKKYLLFMILISFIFTFLILVFSSSNNFNINIVVLNLVTPLLPIYNFLINEFLNIKDSNEKSEGMFNCVKQTFNDLELGIKKTEDLVKVTPANQLIILNNRMSNILIPDWFYNFYRKSQELNMNTTSKSLLLRVLSRVKNTIKEP